MGSRAATRIPLDCGIVSVYHWERSTVRLEDYPRMICVNVTSDEPGKVTGLVKELVNAFAKLKGSRCRLKAVD